jgi:hypothetical protein
MNPILVALVILLIVVIWSSKDFDRVNNKRISGLKDKLEKITKASGYQTRYRLIDHPSSNYTQNKQDIHICTTCDAPENKLLYIGLHEVAHTICKTSKGKHSHDEKWNTVFHDLLATANRLGYLD